MRALLRASTFALVVAGGLALTPQTTRAQAAQDGTLQLGLDLDLAGFYFFPDLVTGLQLGPGSTVDLEVPGPTVSRGLGPQIGFQLGALRIGARVRLGFIYTDIDFGGDGTTGTIAFIPFLEYHLGSGDVVPFIGAQAGFTLLVPNDGDVLGGVLAGGSAGAHIFLAPGFTVSPTLQANFLYDQLFERGGFELVALMSFIGWFSI